MGVAKSVNSISAIFLLLLTFLRADIRVENGTAFIAPEALCIMLEDMFLVFPHKMATGSEADDVVQRNKTLLAQTKEKFINDVKRLLRSSEQMRNDFKGYFDPLTKKEIGIKREADALFKVYLSLSSDANFYSQRLRRLAIADLLSFLKEHVYHHIFPLEYEQSYNEMIISLHHKTVVKKFNDSYAISFPSREFNQDVIFKELTHVWDDYRSFDGQEEVKKTIYLYKTYQILSLIEGELLGEVEKGKYRSIRRDCVSALENLENDPSLKNTSAWFCLKNGKKSLSAQVNNHVEDELVELKGLFKHYYQSFEVSLDPELTSCQKLEFELGPSFREKRYRGYIRLIDYFLSKSDAEEKKIIQEEMREGFQDWIKEYYMPPCGLISQEMPALPSLEEVKKNFELELKNAAVLSSLNSYPCGRALNEDVYDASTCELLNLISQNKISLEKTEFVPSNYKKDPPVPYNTVISSNSFFSPKTLSVLGLLGVVLFMGYKLLKRGRNHGPYTRQEQQQPIHENS